MSFDVINQELRLEFLSVYTDLYKSHSLALHSITDTCSRCIQLTSNEVANTVSKRENLLRIRNVLVLNMNAKTAANDHYYNETIIGIIERIFRFFFNEPFVSSSIAEAKQVLENCNAALETCDEALKKPIEPNLNIDSEASSGFHTASEITQESSSNEPSTLLPDDTPPPLESKLPSKKKEKTPEERLLKNRVDLAMMYASITQEVYIHHVGNRDNPSQILFAKPDGEVYVTNLTDFIGEEASHMVYRGFLYAPSKPPKPIATLRPKQNTKTMQGEQTCPQQICDFFTTQINTRQVGFAMSKEYKPGDLINTKIPTQQTSSVGLKILQSPVPDELNASSFSDAQKSVNLIPVEEIESADVFQNISELKQEDLSDKNVLYHFLLLFNYPMNRIHRIFVDHYGSGTCSFDIFKILPFSECTCSYGIRSSKTGNRINKRLKLEEEILLQIEQRWGNNKTQKLTLVSVGSGNCLQEWVLLSKLLLMGYQNLEIHLLDPMYATQSFDDEVYVQNDEVYVQDDDQVSDTSSDETNDSSDETNDRISISKIKSNLPAFFSQFPDVKFDFYFHDSLEHFGQRTEIQADILMAIDWDIPLADQPRVPINVSANGFSYINKHEPYWEHTASAQIISC